MANSRNNVPRLEELLEEVQEERRLRLDILGMGDMVPRKFKRRPRPKTAIISEAAKVASEVSDWLENASTYTATVTGE